LGLFLFFFGRSVLSSVVSGEVGFVEGGFFFGLSFFLRSFVKCAQGVVFLIAGVRICAAVKHNSPSVLSGPFLGPGASSFEFFLVAPGSFLFFHGGP